MTIWRKSSHSGSEEGTVTCVELADLGDERGIRDSVLGEASPVLQIAPADLRGFLSTLKRS